MSPPDFTPVCGGSVNCITAVTSSAAKAIHWKMAATAFLGPLLFAVMCLWFAKTVLEHRRTRSKLILSTSRGDEIERYQPVRPMLVVVTCATPNVVSAEYRRVGNVVREVTIVPRKPIERMSAFVSQRNEAR